MIYATLLIYISPNVTATVGILFMQRLYYILCLYFSDKIIAYTFEFGRDLLYDI